jgi:CBS domain-containing protein
MIVKEIMSGEVQWISPDVPISEVARIMRDNGIGCVPVGENDRLVGMITDRDITCRAVATGDDLSGVTARNVMSQGMFYCFEDEVIDEAARVMRDRNVHHLPVLNRQKRMVGLVSLGDLALRGKGDLRTSQQVLELTARDAARHARAA